MKKLIKRINYWCTWLFSRKVLEAINTGREYDQVEALVLEMIEKRKEDTTWKTLPKNSKWPGRPRT